MSNPTGSARHWLVYLGVFGGGVVVGILLMAVADSVSDRPPATVQGPTQAAPTRSLTALSPTSTPAIAAGLTTVALVASQTPSVTPTSRVTIISPTTTPASTSALMATPSPSMTATLTASPSPTPTVTRTATMTPSATATTEAHGLAQVMATQVNAERSRSAAITPPGTAGQTPSPPRPLRVDEQLSRVADAHARDMAERGYLSHVNPEGQTPEDRLRAAGVRYTRVNENIYQAYGEGAVEQAMQWLMADPLHRDAILDPRFTRLGVGVYVAPDKKVYFVQLFSSSPED